MYVLLPLERVEVSLDRELENKVGGRVVVDAGEVFTVIDVRYDPSKNVTTVKISAGQHTINHVLSGKLNQYEVCEHLTKQGI